MEENFFRIEKCLSCCEIDGTLLVLCECEDLTLTTAHPRVSRVIPAEEVKRRNLEAYCDFLESRLVFVKGGEEEETGFFGGGGEK